MPKENINEYDDGDGRVEVLWGPDHFNCIQIGVDLNQEFEFVLDNPESAELDDEGNPMRYTGLWIILNTPEKVDRLISALRRAKRKTFS